MRLLKSEWIKLTSTKSVYWLSASAILVAALVAVIPGMVARVSSSSQPTGIETQNDVFAVFAAFGVSFFSIILLWTVAILAVTGEYRFQTMKSTFLVTPSRWPSILVKAAFLAVVVGVLTSVATACALATAQIVSGQSDTTALGETGMRIIWRYGVFAAIGSLAAVGLGYLLRNSAGAVLTIIGWYLIVDQMLVPKLPKVGEKVGGWLPFLNGNYWVFGPMAKGDISWGEGPALILYSVVCLAVFVAGVVVTLRRDA